MVLLEVDKANPGYENVCFLFTGNNVHCVPFLMADTGCPFAAT